MDQVAADSVGEVRERNGTGASASTYLLFFPTSISSTTFPTFILSPSHPTTTLRRLEPEKPTPLQLLCVVSPAFLSHLFLQPDQNSPTKTNHHSHHPFNYTTPPPPPFAHSPFVHSHRRKLQYTRRRLGFSLRSSTGYNFQLLFPGVSVEGHLETTTKSSDSTPEKAERNTKPPTMSRSISPSSSEESGTPPTTPIEQTQLYPHAHARLPGVPSGDGGEGQKKGLAKTIALYWNASSINPRFIPSIAGGIAGFVSGVFTCPLDVMKTKLQAQAGWSRPRGSAGGELKYNGLVGTAKTILREDGLRGMYKGLGPLVLGYFPTWMVYFTVYEKAKIDLREG